MDRLIRFVAYILLSGATFILACGIASFFVDESSLVYVFSEKFRIMGMTMLFAGLVMLFLEKNKKLTSELRSRK